ncbi:hypothetical protein EYF80_014513 [Liparis tanakae]|uniref:Uncharacterized protein n=1 Tax=Liparis tanakae TaxID=230148 RepID=A0A4Z2IBB2_9TELE|nr:hypothetical protein EYF80_014513 [Liparis tanakae]
MCLWAPWLWPGPWPEDRELRARDSWVLSRVLQTSSGVVVAAAMAPAKAPDNMWDEGLYCLWGLSSS